jgi:hypothetical protein
MNNPIVAIILAVLIIGLVLVSIRRGRLKEKYAILWLLVALFSSAAVKFSFQYCFIDCFVLNLSSFYRYFKKTTPNRKLGNRISNN